MNAIYDAYFSKEEITRNFQWKKIIEDDFQKLPEKLKAIDLLKNYIRSLRKVHKVLLTYDHENVKKALDYFDKILELFKDKTMHPFLFKCENIEKLKIRGELELTKIPLFKIDFLNSIYNE